MEQSGIDEDLETLTKWYTAYMTQVELAEVLDAPDSESLDFLEAYEAEALHLMGDIDVTDGFCSTCHTMLDNWPDFEGQEERVVMTDGNKGPRIYPYSSSTDLNPGAWIEHDSRVKCVLPCQGQIVRLDSAARKGCRFCGLVLQTLKNRHWLVLYRFIERRLCRLGKPSKISFVVHTLENWGGKFDVIELGFPGRLFHRFEMIYLPRLYIFRHRDYCELAKCFRASNPVF